MMKSLMLLPAAAAFSVGGTALEAAPATTLPDNKCTEGSTMNGKACPTTCMFAPKLNAVLVLPVTAGLEKRVTVGMPAAAYCMPGYSFNVAQAICEIQALTSAANATDLAKNCFKGIEDIEVKAMVAKAFPAATGSVEAAGVGVLGSFLASNVWEFLTTGKAFTQKDFTKLFNCGVPEAAFGFVVGKAIATVIVGVTNPLLLIAEAAGVAVAKNEFGIAIGCNKSGFKTDTHVARTNSEGAAVDICGSLAGGKGLAAGIKKATEDSQINSAANMVGTAFNSSSAASAATGALTEVNTLKDATVLV